MIQALKGVTVLDIAHVMAGPFCSHLLRLMGARVIKVEKPGEGDVMREYNQDPVFAGMAPPFIAFNAGKESITIDMKAPVGRKIIEQLAGKADVVVENYRPGVLTRLGLGYEQLSKLNPRLVYCSVTGFGQSGPMRDQPAYDHIVQGVCGVMSLTGAPGSGPTKVGFPVVDTFTGYAAAFAAVTALLQREQTGKGEYVDVAMLDCSLVLMASMVAPYLTTGIAPEKVGNRGFNGSPTSDTFPTKDQPITLGANTQKQWESMCKVIGREDLVTDLRFPNPQSRVKNEVALRTELEPSMRKRSASEWEKSLNDVGVPAGAVRTIPEIVAEEHLKTRGVILPVAAPDGGPKGYTLSTGFRFADDSSQPVPAAPRLGQHTDAILRDLGYDDASVARLRTQKIV
jgi:crotonobetainyl-CoA:carnitine CoA-transferase CaiB-like acyl-CoA transferase